MESVQNTLLKATVTIFGPLLNSPWVMKRSDMGRLSNVFTNPTKVPPPSHMSSTISIFPGGRGSWPKPEIVPSETFLVVQA